MFDKQQAFKRQLDRSVDYAAVLDQIADHCSFSLSVEAIRHAMPLESVQAAAQELAFVQEGMEYVRIGKDLSMGGVSDIMPYVQSAQKNIALLSAELNSIALFLSAVNNVCHAFEEEREPRLFEYASVMDPCEKLRRQIEAMIDLSGNIKENATPALYGKIQGLRNAKADLSVFARNFTKKNSNRLMDTTTTSFQGRLCVLARTQDRNSFGGMIHGTSQSGMASYVEPREFVTWNNRIQTLEMEIEEEKRRICRELTALVSQHALALESDMETMTFLDTIMARAKWAYRKDGCIPKFQTRNHAFRFEHARHPLIDEQSVVPNDYACTKDQYCLMVSGPNMGGKTVTLKTIGLFVVLAHAGFPVIAHDAIMPWYDSMWFDIGDDQSIQNNLSTFSSHMSKIARICQVSGEHTLVLLDEIGNGTDPLEGASLATAILSHLIDRKSTIITSTHYDQVKEFGKSDPHTLVSSVEFDLETLKPTYKYLPGISQGSYAFAIAAQLHLDPGIIDNARTIKEENMKESQKALEHLELLQKQTLKKEEKFDALIQHAHQIQKEAEAEKQKWQKKKEQLEADYEQQLEAMLDEKREEARSILAKMKEHPDVKVHEQIESLHEINALGPEKKAEKEAKETFRKGDYVHIDSLNSHGEIVEIRKKQATVLTNGMKVNVKLNVLTKMKRPNVQKTAPRPTLERVTKRFPLELNIIGMRVEEGLNALDRYLDQAIVHKAISVRIIHGMGTGKLRKAVWDDLRKRNTVKSFESAGPSDGGLGATIVTFK